jgi:ABC-type nitrate/sulfonate/bicarbonate transport system substrate-binding protein
MNVRGWKLNAAGALASLTLLAGCGGTAAPASGTAAPNAAAPAGGSAVASAAGNAAFGKPETPNIKVVYATASGEDTFVELAKSKGFFQKYGLTADVQYAQSSTGMVAITSGEAQMGLSDGVAAAQAITSGTPVKVIAYFDQISPYMVVTLPEAPTAADLKGKTMAVGKLADTSDVSMRIGMKKTGVVPGKDFNVLAVGNSPARWAALSSHQVAGAILDEETYLPQAKAQGMHVIADMRAEKLPYVASALTVTDSFAKSNPNTILAALRALMDAAQFYADPKNKDEAMAQLAKDLRMKPDDPVAQAAYEAYHARAAGDPYPGKDGISTILGALTEIDATRYGKVTPEQIIDPSFMDKLRAASSAPKS